MVVNVQKNLSENEKQKLVEQKKIYYSMRKYALSYLQKTVLIQEKLLFYKGKYQKLFFFRAYV